MSSSLEIRAQEAAEELIRRLDSEQLDWSQNAAVAGVFEDEKMRNKYPTFQACHASLDNLCGAKRVVNALMNGEGYATGRVLPPEVELWFVDYILNRSPYAETFITKDAAQALKQRYTISSGDHPSNLMAAGMVALRRLWEYTYVAKAAYSLHKAGVNEDLAFLLGHLVTTSNNPEDHTATSWQSCHNGHCSLNPNAMGWVEVKNFINHNIKSPNGLFSKGAGYSGYDNMFGRSNGVSYYRFVREDFPYDKCKEKAEVNLNPFTKAIVVNNNSVPYSKAIEVMAEWANTTLMEKINNA